MQIGEKLPSFDFSATSGLEGNLKDYQGKWLILYFYPKDATPGCTTEGQNFRDAYDQIKAINADILGVSRDSLKSHENFKAKQHFPFELIADKEEKLCHLFDVIKMKTMYGKQVRGIERSTFLIDPKGILKKEWRNVKVKEHVAEVLHSIHTLQSST